MTLSYPTASDAIDDIAQRHGFSTDAIRTMLKAITTGHATMAQFNHSEFSGPGQWMRGGMTMVSDMFNHGLKERVDALCRELSDFVVHQSLPDPSDGAQPGRSDDARPWADLGWPDSTGSQNGMRYAYHSGARRLVIENGGQVTVYDTGDHRITGFAQQQSGASTLSFSSQHGPIDLANLPVIKGEDTLPRSLQKEPLGAPPVLGRWDVSVAPAGGMAEICSTIEKLADLHQRGILDNGEFARKKLELLDRL